MSENATKIFFKSVEGFEGRIGHTNGNYPKGTYHDLLRSNTAECKSIDRLVKKGRLEYVPQDECEDGIAKQFADYEAELEKRRENAAANDDVEAPSVAVSGSAEVVDDDEADDGSNDDDPPVGGF